MAPLTRRRRRPLSMYTSRAGAMEAQLNLGLRGLQITRGIVDDGEPVAVYNQIQALVYTVGLGADAHLAAVGRERGYF